MRTAFERKNTVCRELPFVILRMAIAKRKDSALSVERARRAVKTIRRRRHGIGLGNTKTPQANTRRFHIDENKGPRRIENLNHTPEWSRHSSGSWRFVRRHEIA